MKIYNVRETYCIYTENKETTMIILLSEVFLFVFLPCCPSVAFPLLALLKFYKVCIWLEGLNLEDVVCGRDIKFLILGYMNKTDVT